MVVYSELTAGFDEVARKIADERGDSLVSDLETIDADEPVLYVDHPAEIDEEVLLALQKRQLDVGPSRGSFGVVTGFTPAAAESLYFSEKSTEGDHLLVNAEGGPKTLSVDDERTIAFGTEQSTVENLESATDRPLSSFAINIGGSTIHWILKDGYICGFSGTSENPNSDKLEPFCMRDGEMACPYDANLLPVERISAAHVFANGCIPIIANTTTGTAAHVGLSLLENAKSLIGPYRNSYIHVHEMLFYHSLLRAGYPTDEITYILNRNSHVNNIMGYPYVLFGRPGTRLHDRKRLEYEYRQVDGGTTIELTDIDDFVVDVSVPASIVDELPDRPYVFAEEELNGKTYYSTFVEGDDIRIFVYTGDRIRRDSLRLRLGERLYRYADRRIARSSIEGADRISAFDLADDRAREQVTDLTNQVESLEQKSTIEGFRLDASADSGDHIDSVLGSINAVADILIDTLADGEQLLKLYGHRVKPQTQSASSKHECPRCGKTLRLKVVSDPLENSSRILGSCPSQTVCGTQNKFDVPMPSRETDLSFPTIRGDLTSGERGEREIEITFQNPSSDPMQVTFFPSIWRIGDRVGSTEIFSPRTSRERLEPRAETTVRFTIDADVLEDNEHYILARVIGNLDVYSGLSPFMVGNKGSVQFRE